MNTDFRSLFKVERHVLGHSNLRKLGNSVSVDSDTHGAHPINGFHRF